MIKVGILALAFLAPLASTSSAMASTISAIPHGAEYKATKGSVANNVSVTATAHTLTISDSAEHIIARHQCVTLTPHSARCKVSSPGRIGFKLNEGDNKIVVHSLPSRWAIAHVLVGRGNDKVLAASISTSMFAYGKSGNDTIVGGSGADDLRGMYGDDRITGGAGDDYIGLGFGDDYVDAGPGNDDLSGTGGPGDDTIKGGDGNDSMFPSGTFNQAEWAANTGVDTVDGGPGDDNLSALDARGHPAADHITCGPGNDSVEADTLDVIASDCERVDFPPPGGDCFKPDGTRVPCFGGQFQSPRISAVGPLSWSG